MNEHCGLTEENLLRVLPQPLRRDARTAALAASVAEVLAGRREEIETVRLYADLSRLPEALLDILAYDFKVDWWDGGFSPEEKRDTLRSGWRVHRLLGTKAAVEMAVTDAFGGGKVSEWFEYGGEPYRFRISGVPAETVAAFYDGFLALLRKVQRQSAVLECILLQYKGEQNVYTGFSVRIGRKMAVGCEIPAALDVTYLTDEDGNLLADELRARITDEEG